MRDVDTSRSRPCGIQYSTSNTRDAYLPLVRAEVHADVVDVSAIITITQQFWQHSLAGLERAKYVFPVPARAAVCAFQMTAADGTVITAVAKEKEQARREHEAAISQGYMTGLVEHVTDDIFTISLGALPSNQMITTEITYVLDLMDEEVTDQVRLQIPMYVGMRYGSLPMGMHNAVQAPPERVSISVDVRMQGAVRSITSPTHPALILSDGGAHASRAAWGSRDFLTSDFVLAVAADGLDAPRCFAQRARTGATALQLNIVPRFNLPAVPRQEYVFLVDRSGSMEGERIDTAKRTLVMLLRALPSRGTKVNIFSFGNRCDGLWYKSVPYDESTLKHATEYVDRMRADYGGTEILNALNQVFKSRETSMPTACFVLTDGEAYDEDRVFESVQYAVKRAKPSAPLRVFTLGIGGTASSAMCEGIARAGNGVCLFATSAESIIGKCSKLVRASRTYILKNVSIDWGVRTDLAAAHRTGDTTLRGVRQAPADVAAIYPGTRFVVCALVEDADYKPPREVVIRAQRDGHGEVLAFSVPVQAVPAPADARPALLPTLAARRAIMDLEDGARGARCPPDVRDTVVRLGTAYQLASKYTSFVAVDRRPAAQQSAEKTAKRLLEPVPGVDIPPYYDPTIEDASDYGWGAPRGWARSSSPQSRRSRSPRPHRRGISPASQVSVHLFGPTSDDERDVRARRRSRSPSPIVIHDQGRARRRSPSYSPPRRRSPSPRYRRSPSYSPDRRRSRTPSPPHDSVPISLAAAPPHEREYEEVRPQAHWVPRRRMARAARHRTRSPSPTVVVARRSRSRSRSRSPSRSPQRVVTRGARRSRSRSRSRSPLPVVINSAPRPRSPQRIITRGARRSRSRSSERCLRPSVPQPVVIPPPGQAPTGPMSAPACIPPPTGPAPVRVAPPPFGPPYIPPPSAGRPVVVSIGAPPVPPKDAAPAPARHARRASTGLGASLRSAFAGLSLRKSSSASASASASSAADNSSSPPPPPAGAGRVSHGRHASLSSVGAKQSRASRHTVQVEYGVPPDGYVPPPTPPPVIVPIVASRSPQPTSPRSPRPAPSPAAGRPETAEDRVLALVRLQSFDGSFAASRALRALLGGALLDAGRALGVDARVWATVLAVAFLRKYMRDQPELLEGLVEKAMAYVEGVQGVDVGAVVARARELVG